MRRWRAAWRDSARGGDGRGIWVGAEVETRPDLGGSGPQSRSVLAVAGRKRQPEYDSASKVRAFAVRAKSSTNVTLSTLAPMSHRSGSE